MKSKIKLLFLSIYLLSVYQLSAQLDNNSGTKEKGETKAIVLNSSKEIKKTNSIDLNTSNGFKNAYKIEKEKLKKQQEEKKLNNKGVLTKAQLYEFRTKEMYGKRTIEKVDSHQGNFLTMSKTVTISFRDFGAIDGDIIAIYVNDKPIVNKTTLNHHYQSYQIDLEKGDNKIEIVALNQGSLGANTAQYKLVNSSGLKIASKYWFLATGARAIFNITKN
jgi:hypothetical protein